MRSLKGQETYQIAGTQRVPPLISTVEMMIVLAHLFESPAAMEEAIEGYRQVAIDAIAHV